MKKKLLYAIGILAVLPLFGCFNAIPELSEEKEVRVVRYMADAVLEHDVNYQARLLDEKEKEEALLEEARKAEQLKKIEEEEIKKKEEKEASNTPDDIKTSAVSKTYEPGDINDYFGIDGVEFELAGVETVYKYPENDENLGFAFTSSDGNKLMVVKMNINNNSGEDAYVDLVTVNPKFKAVVNDNTKVSASKVPLGDVLNFFEGTIEPGSVKQSVLIFEIPENLALDKVDLSISAFGKDAIKVNLK